MFLLREEAGTSKKKALKRDLVSEGLLTVALLVVLAFVLFSLGSAGWFASSSSGANAGNVQVAAKLNDYTLLIDRTTTYDQTIAGTPVYSGVAELKTKLHTDHEYDLTATSTEVSPKLAYELVNESSVRVEGVDEYFLMPGSYGTLTFYIQPNFPGTFTTDLYLDLGAYKDDYDEHDNPVILEVTNDHLLQFLRGHILFFTGRTGADPEDYRYSGFIDDGVFEFTTQGNTKVPGEDYYQITLYWEWPLTYFEIDENMSTTAPAVTKRYPTDLRTFIDNNRGFVFAANQNLLNDGYNDADQIIGEGADYFVAYICNQ